MDFSISVGYGNTVSWRLALERKPEHFRPWQHLPLPERDGGEGCMGKGRPWEELGHCTEKPRYKFSSHCDSD